MFYSRISIDVLNRLPNIKFLEYRNIVYFPEDGASDFTVKPLPSENTLQSLNFATSLHTQLQGLSIDATRVDRIPVWVYNNLTILEMTSENFNDIANFDFVCHHCPTLEDLSITGIVHSAICLSLPQETAFPRLHSFRLSCEMLLTSIPSKQHIIALTRFILSHKHLRRLYLRIADADFDDIETLLPAIEDLRRLEVLGLHTGTNNLDDHALEFVLTCSPLTLNALPLAMSWDGVLAHVSILVRFRPAPNMFVQLTDMLLCRRIPYPRCPISPFCTSTEPN